jgi:hypothetical protein
MVLMPPKKKAEPVVEVDTLATKLLAIVTMIEALANQTSVQALREQAKELHEVLKGN